MAQFYMTIDRSPISAFRIPIIRGTIRLEIGGVTAEEELNVSIPIPDGVTLTEDSQIIVIGELVIHESGIEEKESVHPSKVGWARLFVPTISLS